VKIGKSLTLMFGSDELIHRKERKGKNISALRKKKFEMINKGCLSALSI